jgi:hypothetical protein
MTWLLTNLFINMLAHGQCYCRVSAALSRLPLNLLLMRVTKLRLFQEKKGCVLKKPHDRSENFYYIIMDDGRFQRDDFSVSRDDSSVSRDDFSVSHETNSLPVCCA